MVLKQKTVTEINLTRYFLKASTTFYWFFTFGFVMEKSICPQFFPSYFKYLF